MSHNNVQFVKSLYDSFAAGDVPAVLAGLHDQVEWNEAENFPYADHSPYIGPAALAEGLFRRLGEDWEYWHADVDDLLDAGDNVLAMGRYRAAHKGTGKKLDAQFAHVWWVRDGKVVKFQQYVDTLQVAGAVSG